MKDNVLFSNDYINITSSPDGVYIESFKKGFLLNDINPILSSHPEIHFENFMAIKNSIAYAPVPRTKIGSIKPRIQLDILDSSTKAYITLNISTDELNDTTQIENEIRDILAQNSICYGIDTDFIKNEKLVSGKKYLVASGKLPVDGENAQIRILKINELHPKASETENKINFYETAIINHVNQGELLAERIEPTPGIDGITVKNEIISAKPGKALPFSYDPKTVLEVSEDGKTCLYSKLSGAFNIVDNRIAVSNHLELSDVDFKTGNINFDGFVTIKGTVADGFSVTATNDIEINSNLGIGNVKNITSTNGSILIKGGITSKGNVDIYAARNIITKYIENAHAVCGEIIYIDSHCINSVITAKQIIISSYKGQVIGGILKAQTKISVAILGCDREKRTILEVEGVSRRVLEQEMKDIIERLDKYKNEQKVIKKVLEGLNAQKSITEKQKKDYYSLIDRSKQLKDIITDSEEKRKNLVQYLKIKGDGEITITKVIYPNCLIIICKNHFEITSKTLPTSYYCIDGEIKIN